MLRNSHHLCVRAYVQVHVRECRGLHLPHMVQEQTTSTQQVRTSVLKTTQVSTFSNQD